MLETAEHSALAYRVSAGVALRQGRERTLILLPPAPGPNERLLKAVRAAGWEGKVITLLPPRAIYHGEQIQGFTWFHALEPHLIEPTSFEDSLWHVERFVLDLLEAQSTPDELVLVGVGEGASVVMAAEPYLYDRIAAALAIEDSSSFEALRDDFSRALSDL